MLDDAVPTQLWPGKRHQARGIFDLVGSGIDLTNPVAASLTVTRTGPSPVIETTVISASIDSSAMPTVDSTTATVDETFIFVPA